MKTKIVICVVALLALVTLFVIGYNEKSSQTASVQAVGGSHSIKSQLTVSENLYDFGTISMKSGNVTKEFVVNNLTDKDITLKTVLTSCMCTSAFIVKEDGNVKGPFKMPGMGYVPPANELIKAGENRVIRVVYDPNAHGPAGIGSIDRFIALTDTEGGTLQLEIKAFVTP